MNLSQVSTYLLIIQQSCKLGLFEPIKPTVKQYNRQAANPAVIAHTGVKPENRWRRLCPLRKLSNDITLQLICPKSRPIVKKRKSLSENLGRVRSWLHQYSPRVTSRCRLRPLPSVVNSFSNLTLLL